MNTIDLAIVVAVAKNGTIGRDNEMPWHLPEDLKYFKRTTLGHPVVMGRKTYDSIGKPLPGRTNIVVTRDINWKRDGVVVAHSLEEAIKVGKQVAEQTKVSAVMVIGGAEFYRQVLPQAQRLYLTEVHADVLGDATFPALNRAEWEELERRDYVKSEKNPYDYSFVTLTRLQ